MKPMRFILTFLAFFVSTVLMGQLSPVSWSFTSEHIGNDEFHLIATASIDEGWYTYSQEKAEDGPSPTEFEFYTSDHFELIGTPEESGNRKESVEEVFGGITVIKFIGTGVFTQKVRVTDTSLPIEGYLSYMTCNGELCLPPKDVDFSFQVTVPKNIVVEPLPQPSDTEVSSTIIDEPKEEEIQPVEPDYKISQKEPKESTPSITEISTPGFEAVGVEATSSPGFSNEGAADQDQPVVWDFKAKPLGNNKYRLYFHADIAEGWSLYSPFIDEDAGPNPTYFEINASDFFTKSGGIEESENVITKFDKVFEAEISKFFEYATFTQDVQVSKDDGVIDGYVSFMTCNDETCLPPKDIDFAFNIGNVTTNAPIAGDGEVDLSALKNADTQGIFNSRREIDSESYLADCGDAHSTPDSKSMLAIFILGFLGGLVALLTPCVFPMIPLTVSFFTNRGADKASGIRKAIIYGLSIIVIYVVVGIALTSFFGPTILNEMAVNPWFNLVFFALLVVFAFSFFGFFELTLPSSWVNSTDRAADKGGLFGIFFMAGTLALVSFSCTGPIIGTLLVETVSNIQPDDIAFGFIPKRPFMGMFGFAIALALPFTLFAAFPAWLNSLPKSGSWMTAVKVTLGFLELALAFKFLSTADLTGEWEFLKYELFVGIWILIFALMALWYFGLLRFPHDSPVEKLSLGRKGFGVASLAFAIYLGTTFNGYQPLWILSGISPPINYSYWNAKDCPYGLDCYKDFDKGLAAARAQDKPLFVDFTGHGCQNCRKMEDFVWKEEQILSKLRDDYIVISLYVDDRARLFPEDNRAHLLDQHTGERLRTVGSKWASFEISNFNRSSQPYYVLMHNDGKTLLNKPVAYTPDVEAYNSFLECGLSAFRSLAMR